MDLVVATADQETWEKVCKRAGLPSTRFSNTTVYDDSVTYDLVEAASQELDLNPRQVLESFGRHWILFTGQEGWGPLFEMAGPDLRSFVEGLDAMHARVQASMPECRMPSFSVSTDSDGSLDVAYQSERNGLEPMVLGLLAGLAEHFDEKWNIREVGPNEDGSATMFKLCPVEPG
jgi:hypothetical protein